jgi:hypothetical protein
MVLWTIDILSHFLQNTKKRLTFKKYHGHPWYF